MGEAQGPVDASTPRAGLPQRVGARVLQTLIWAVVASLLGLALSAVLPDPAPWGLIGAAVLLLAYGPYVAEALLVGLNGWDPGKFAVGLEVRDARRRDLIGVGPAALRSLVLHAPFFLSAALIWVPGNVSELLGWAYVPWLLFLLWTMSRDPEQQGLHDKVAGSVVLQVRSEAGPRRLGA